MVTCQSTQNTSKGFLGLQNGLSVWFTRLHNHEKDCWSDSCLEDNHWQPSQGCQWWWLRRDTQIIVKRFVCTAIHNKALYKCIIHTFIHKEGKPQQWIAIEAGCSLSAVSEHFNKVEWKEKVLKKKMHNQPRGLQPYDDCQAKSIQFLKTNVTAPVYQYILEHFMLPSADQLFKYADFIFQQDLAPAHIAKSTKSWLNDHGVGVLDWPANSPDLNPIENLIVKRKMRNKRPKNADELKATVKETWLPYNLSSATNWSPPCHAELRQ